MLFSDIPDESKSVSFVSFDITEVIHSLVILEMVKM